MTKKGFRVIDALVGEPGHQALLLASGERYLRSLTNLMNDLTKDPTRKGMLISTQWSANALGRRLSLSKVPKGNLRVIDTVSMTLGSAPGQSDDFRFLPAPAALESILIEVERWVRAGKGELDFLLIDTLSSFRKRYSREELLEFLHFLLNRMLEEEISTVIFDHTSQEGTQLTEELSSLMDSMTCLGEEG